jgi:hypothetical protein
MDPLHMGEESYDKPWPSNGVSVTSRTNVRWFTKPGYYYFVKHDSSGHRIFGSGRTVQVFEGNHQLSGDPDYTPQNLVAVPLSASSIQLTFNLSSDLEETNVRVY